MASSTITHPQVSPPARAVPLAVGGLLLLTALAFWPSWRAMPNVWAQSRGHGVFAVLLSLVLLWRQRNEVRPVSGPAPVGLLVLGALTLLWLAAVILSAQVIHLSTVPLVLLAWAATVFGWTILAPLAPAAAAFSLALPIWEVLIWPLQMVTVLVNRLLLAITPFSAEIDGTSIHLPAGTLVVADSCAGLNFLMASLLVGTAYAMFFESAWRTRWRLIGMAAGLALVANWIRVFGLVVVADVTAMQSSLMKDHGTYGWIIFAGAMAVFFALAERMSAVSRGIAPGVEATATVPTANRPFFGVLPARTAIIAAAATLTAALGPALLFLADGSRQARRSLPPLTGLTGASGWTSQLLEGTAERWQPSFVGASEHVSTMWTSGTDTVQVDRFLYDHQQQGRELIGGSNAIAAERDRVADRIIGPLDASLRTVREAAVREPRRSADRTDPMTVSPPNAEGNTVAGNGTPQLRLAWYWYRVAGIATSSPTKAKLLELLAFVRPGAPSEVVVASTPCEDTKCASARTRLLRLVGGTRPEDRTAP